MPLPYTMSESVLDRVRGRHINEKLTRAFSDDVENGSRIVVNYTDEDYSHNGITVAAKSYSVLERRANYECVEKASAGTDTRAEEAHARERHRRRRGNED